MSKKEKSCSTRRTSIGGQALIEGIMMRGPKRSAMAVRNTQGEIVLEKWDTETAKANAFFKAPVVRGVYNFIMSMKAGYKCLMRSAEISGLEEIEAEMQREKEEKKRAKKAKKQESAAETAPMADATETVETPEVESEPVSDGEKTEEKKKAEKKESSVMMGVIMAVAMVLAVGLAILLFFMLPTFLYEWICKLIPALKPENAALSSLIKSAFEGLLRIMIMVAYMAAVALMKDIRRTFQYHGAEHKTIFCYEHGKALTVANVRGERRFHPRCGTSFLVLMLLVGIFVSFFIDPLFIATTGSVPHPAIRACVKLITLPITMGLGYELIRMAGRHDNLFTRIVSAPGMWLQRVTVLEPSDDMIECALAAFIEALPAEEREAEEAKIAKESGCGESAPEKSE